MSANWNVLIATERFLSMGTDSESTVLMPVMWQTDLEMTSMKTDQLMRERNYLATLHVIRGMLQRNLITQREYVKARQKLLKKYDPVIGPLLSENDLL